jgi:hypothetical protein
VKKTEGSGKSKNKITAGFSRANSSEFGEEVLTLWHGRFWLPWMSRGVPEASWKG